jgi:cytochrome oxidase Cu insertion factor (SCO1/SenC/PrrC family)
MKRAIMAAGFILIFMVVGAVSLLGDTQPAWADIKLKNVNTGKTFTISDFEGKPVLLETFAVWCSTCTKQQKEIKRLHEELGDSFVSITLDVDPNESERLVKKHASKYGFDWYYAVAPPEMTRLLIDQFGTTVVNAPAAPIILLSENYEARLLKRGVKTSEELKLEIEKGSD